MFNLQPAYSTRIEATIYTTNEQGLKHNAWSRFVGDLFGDLSEGIEYIK